MSKVLFISTATIHKFTGGTSCSKRNLKILKDIFGIENVKVIYTEELEANKASVKYLLKYKLIDILMGNMNGYSIGDYKFWKNLLTIENPEILFLDSSTIGNIIPLARKINSNIRVYTFFHNSEYIYMKQWILHDRKFHKFYYVCSAKKNERTAVRYSNKCIFLNVRDYELSAKIYGCVQGKIIPLSIDDHTRILGEGQSSKNNKNKVGLFVGSWFYANEHGIRWFMEYVLPKVNMLLIIVGFGMDKLKIPSIVKDKVKVYTNVPSLDEYYKQADFVVSPIFLGSGMKVKTCEALSYGKYIIGTPEAWEGYDYSHAVGQQCRTADEFIHALNNLGTIESYNLASARLFQQKYSYDAVRKSFEQVFL